MGLVATAIEPLAAQQFAPIGGLAFTKTFAGANPLPQTITVTSLGAPFFFSSTSSTSTGGNWLIISPACGNNCLGTPRVITVSVNPTATLAAMTYTGQIVLSSGSTSLVIPVALTIAPPASPFLDNVAAQLSFSLRTGGATPAAKSVQIRNGAAGALNWNLTSSAGSGGNWLRVSATLAACAITNPRAATYKSTPLITVFATCTVKSTGNSLTPTPKREADADKLPLHGQHEKA